MSDESKQATLDPRKFMVVVDNTPECEIALYYAARRAIHTKGKLTLLKVIEPEGFAHWASVAKAMRAEAFAEAETLMKQLSSQAHQVAGLTPEIVIREGKLREEVLGQIKDDPAISILVLGASTGKDGPGPLVSSLTGPMAGQMRIPITVVPGNLAHEALDALA